MCRLSGPFARAAGPQDGSCPTPAPRHCTAHLWDQELTHTLHPGFSSHLRSQDVEPLPQNHLEESWFGPQPQPHTPAPCKPHMPQEASPATRLISARYPTPPSRTTPSSQHVWPQSPLTLPEGAHVTLPLVLTGLYPYTAHTPTRLHDNPLPVLQPPRLLLLLRMPYLAQPAQHPHLSPGITATYTLSPHSLPHSGLALAVPGGSGRSGELTSGHPLHRKKQSEAGSRLTCNMGRLRGVEGQAHDGAGHLHHCRWLLGVQASPVQVPGTHEGLQGAPVPIIQPAQE